MARRQKAQSNKSKKFLPRCIGPFQISKRVSATCYKVQDLPCNRKKRICRIFNAHVSQLRRYRSRCETEWIPKQQIDDEEEVPDEADEMNLAVNSDGSDDDEDPQTAGEDQSIPLHVDPESNQLANRIVTRSARTVRPPNRNRDFIPIYKKKTYLCSIFLISPFSSICWFSELLPLLSKFLVHVT